MHLFYQLVVVILISTNVTVFRRLSALIPAVKVSLWLSARGSTWSWHQPSTDVIESVWFSAIHWHDFFVFQRFETKYNAELAKGPVSKETTFEYAWCLIRSKHTNDIVKGIHLLEGQFFSMSFSLWSVTTFLSYSCYLTYSWFKILKVILFSFNRTGS